MEKWNWRLDSDLGGWFSNDIVRFQLNFDKILSDMHAIEEAAHVAALCQALRGKGYIVIPPQEEQEGGL